MEKFIRELRAAKQRGVNVSKVFVEDEERLELMRARTFGLKLAIIWVFAAPIALVAFEAYCVERGINVSVPHDLIYWTCGMGFVSILAFGYDLVDLASLWRGVISYVKPMLPAKEAKPNLEITVKLEHSKDEADGDV